MRSTFALFCALLFALHAPEMVSCNDLSSAPSTSDAVTPASRTRPALKGLAATPSLILIPDRDLTILPGQSSMILLNRAFWPEGSAMGDRFPLNWKGTFTSSRTFGDWFDVTIGVALSTDLSATIFCPITTSYTATGANILNRALSFCPSSYPFGFTALIVKCTNTALSCFITASGLAVIPSTAGMVQPVMSYAPVTTVDIKGSDCNGTPEIITRYPLCASTPEGGGMSYTSSCSGTVPIHYSYTQAGCTGPSTTQRLGECQTTMYGPAYSTCGAIASPPNPAVVRKFFSSYCDPSTFVEENSFYATLYRFGQSSTFYLKVNGYNELALESMVCYPPSEGGYEGSFMLVRMPTPTSPTTPTPTPTSGPTAAPTVTPTVTPTAVPTTVPTANPTTVPTAAPTSNPGSNPTNPTTNPTSPTTPTPTSSSSSTSSSSTNNAQKGTSATRSRSSNTLAIGVGVGAAVACIGLIAAVALLVANKKRAPRTSSPSAEKPKSSQELQVSNDTGAQPQPQPQPHPQGVAPVDVTHL